MKIIINIGIYNLVGIFIFVICTNTYGQGIFYSFEELFNESEIIAEFEVLAKQYVRKDIYLSEKEALSGIVSEGFPMTLYKMKVKDGIFGINRNEYFEIYAPGGEYTDENGDSFFLEISSSYNLDVGASYVIFTKKYEFDDVYKSTLQSSTVFNKVTQGESAELVTLSKIKLYKNNSDLDDALFGRSTGSSPTNRFDFSYLIELSSEN